MGMITPDLMNIRSKIEKYTEDRDLQMLFKAVYLLGAKECEMLGEKYGSDSKTHVYGPTGDDSWEKPESVHDTQVNTVFFRIRTAKTRGREERIVLLPSDYEPWAKQLHDYFKEKGVKKVFPFNRVQIRDRVIKSKVLEGLKKPVTYNEEEKWKPLGLDDLRWGRKEELEDKYGFKEAHLKVYGIMKIDRRQTPDKRLDDSKINELKKEYLWKLCKHTEPEEEDNNLLFVDGIRIDVDDLIEKGENEKTEFKSSLCWDFEKKCKNKIIEVAVAKAVASLLNSNGGFILIGVRDDKTLLGLEGDFGAINKPTTDAFELHFTTMIGNYLGAENRPYVTMRFTERKGKKIAIVVIPKKAPKEVFLTVDGEPSFYIRSGNSSRPLNVKEATEYIRQHWEKTK
jgi:hypothetical protein